MSEFSQEPLEQAAIALHDLRNHRHCCWDEHTGYVQDRYLEEARVVIRAYFAALAKMPTIQEKIDAK